MLKAALLRYLGAPTAEGLIAFEPLACVYHVVTAVLSATVVVPFNKSDRNHNCRLDVTPPGAFVIDESNAFTGHFIITFPSAPKPPAP